MGIEPRSFQPNALAFYRQCLATIPLKLSLYSWVYFCHCFLLGGAGPVSAGGPTGPLRDPDAACPGGTRYWGYGLFFWYFQYVA